MSVDASFLAKVIVRGLRRFANDIENAVAEQENPRPAIAPDTIARPFGRPPLSKQQATCLAFIKQSIVDRGIPPTVREIGAHMGIGSTNGVADHLQRLANKGYIRREFGHSRAIQLVGDDEVDERAGMAPTGTEEG